MLYSTRQLTPTSLMLLLCIFTTLNFWLHPLYHGPSKRSSKKTSSKTSNVEKKHSRALWGITLRQKSIHWPWFPATAKSHKRKRNGPEMIKCYESHRNELFEALKESFQVGWHDRFQRGSVPWSGWQQPPFFSRLALLWPGACTNSG